MSANPMTCSHCGTENSPARDTCVACGQPLTASADMALRANLAATEGHRGLVPDWTETRLDLYTGGSLPGVPASGEVHPNLPRP